MATPQSNQWLGILKWSLQHHDGTGPQAPSTLSTADRNWLLKAMESGGVDDGVGVIKKALAEIAMHISAFEEFTYTASSMATATATTVEVEVGEGRISTAESLDSVFTILETMGDMVDDIDQAIAFHSLNGTELFTKILSFSPPPKSPHFPQFTLCQAEACRVLGIVVQNNEKIQKDIATFPPANNPIFAATSLYNRCTTPSLLPTIISSISRMIRGSELLEGTFLSSPELSSLLDIVSSHLLASPQAKLTRVTVFFIRALATSDFTTDYEFLTENSLQLLKTAAFPAGGGATDTDMLESGASFWHQVLRQGGQNFDPKTNPPSTLPHFVAVRKLCVSLKNSVTLNLLDTARLALLSEGEHYEVYLEELRSVVELLVENDFDSPMDMKVQQQVQGGKTDSDLGIVQDFNDVKQHKNNNSNSKSPKEMTVTNEWQKIPEGMSVPKGCEFKMNFSTGVNEVRALQGQGENNNNQQIVVIDEV